MDTSDSFVTAVSNVGNPSPTGANTCGLPESEVNATGLEGVIEVTAMSIEERETVTDALQANETLDPSVEVAKGSSAVEPSTATTPEIAAGPPNVESSSTDESCGAYIARKWEQLGTSQEPCTSSQADGKDAKYSESVMMELIPGQRPTDYEEADNDSVSEVAFLDTPKLPPKSNLKSLYRPTEAKVQKLCVKMGDTRREHSISDYETEGLSTSEGYSADEFEDAGQDDTVIRVSPNKSGSDRAQESDGPIGSTVAEALYAPVQSNMFRVSDVASNTSADFPEVMPRVAQLSASGRALIKEYFEEATPVRLPPGHSTLALNEGQVSHMLKV